MGFDHPQWEMFKSSKHGIIWDIEGNNPGNQSRTPTRQKCHMNNGDHEVRTSWGFLGLRIPTKANVLALIKVVPTLKEQLTKLAAALPGGNSTTSTMIRNGPSIGRLYCKQPVYLTPICNQPSASLRLSYKDRQLAVLRSSTRFARK